MFRALALVFSSHSTSDLKSAGLLKLKESALLYFRAFSKSLSCMTGCS